MSTKHNYKQDIQKSFKEELKVELHSRKNKRGGLCADCIRAESCILSHNSDATIWNCEDYQNEEVAPVAAESRKEETFKVEAAGEKASSNPGICAHCIHRDNCSLKSLEGGIWHCEDYA